MGRITLSLINRFREWERPSQVAMVMALVLLVVTIALASVGTADVRAPAVIGVMGLLLVMQFIVLWANRDLVTSYTQAQRHYLAGDFEAARVLLEAAREGADMRALTLLGNTYRQLGRLDESDAALNDALAQDAAHHFPLYGLGRTRLAQGRYADAAVLIQQAIEAGAPETVQADLGEALYRAGALNDARTILNALVPPDDEPHRALLIAYLRWRLGDGQRPSQALLDAGLPYWTATAERFAHTPYGQHVAGDVQDLMIE